MPGLLFCFVIIAIGDRILGARGGRRLPGLEFKTQPQDTTAVPGSTVELACDTKYLNGDPEFYWILNGSKLLLSNIVPRKSFVYNLSRSNGDLRIENIAEEACGLYQCVAQYSGRAIISRKANVRMAYLYKTSAPSSTNLVCNESYPFLLKPPVLVSFPEPSFVWEYRRYINETFTTVKSLVRFGSRLVLSLEGILCIRGFKEIDQGQYRCVITNDTGTVVQLYSVTLGEKNVSSGQNNTRPVSVLVNPKNVTVAASSSASFDCIASEKNAQIRWMKGEKLIDTSENYDITSPYRLIIKQATSDDEGWYTCVISNTVVVQKAFLNVRDAVKLSTNWPKTQEILNGEVLLLKATASHGTIEWYWNGQLIDDNFLNGSFHNITREITEVGGEIVKDEQTLRLESMSMRGMYQVLGTGYNDQVSKHTEVITYGCGGIITARDGTFNTPNFPGPYPINTQCLWIIKPDPKPNTDTLFLEIDHFNVGSRACRDDLEIKDGETPTSGMFGIFPPGRPTTFTSHLSAFRLLFKSGSCNVKHSGFNATYWIADTTSSLNTEPISLATKHDTTAGPTIFSTETTITAERTTGQDEGSMEQSSSESNVIVYGVVVFVCVVVLVIALLLLIRRKGNFIQICIKGNKPDDRREDTERNEHELHHYTSTEEIIPSPEYDTPGDKDSSIQPTNQAQESPLYAVLENLYATVGQDQCSQNLDQSKDIYATVNEGVDEETLYASGNFEVSFLEEIYTTLAADRRDEDVNIYESLCDAKHENERSDSWSVRGMQSVDEDYVSII